ncbi:MAG: hypothetical protein EOM90_15910 [Alphaproteobacteria bacterium]|nr:hypothetical protein [Alphaproteobacteria bacterium]
MILKILSLLQFIPFRLKRWNLLILTVSNVGQSCPGTPTVVYEGQTYNTVQIGTQCWFKENLNVGTVIPGNQNQTNNQVIEKFCYNYLESNCDIYGGLYQWDEAMQYLTTAGVQGICPVGWHLPTDAEWTTLTTFLGGVSIAGGKMKETGTTHWASPNTGATNSSGFTAFPGGFRHSIGSFGDLTYYAFFWSSSQNYATTAWGRLLYHDNASVYRNDYNIMYGLSGRCLKDSGSSTTTPTVSTTSVSNVTQTSAQSGGSVTNDGGATVTARGVCWSTSPNPTVSDNYTTDGSGTGTFTSSLSNLTTNTLYYVRAYATNSAGTSYGNQVSFYSFSETGQPCAGLATVTDTRDGKTYNTVQIGTQCWLKENLNIGTRINGTQEQTDNQVIEKYCYDDLESNCNIYGGLYQWNELMQYTTLQGVQGLCPTGWHIPTNDEWYAVTDYLGGANAAGGKMKSTGTIQAGTGLWYHPNTATTNETGFTSVPGGNRKDSDGSFDAIGGNSKMWSSYESNSASACSRYMYYDQGKVGINCVAKGNGFSVRCLKD